MPKRRTKNKKVLDWDEPSEELPFQADNQAQASQDATQEGRPAVRQDDDIAPDENVPLDRKPTDEGYASASNDGIKSPELSKLAAVPKDSDIAEEPAAKDDDLRSMISSMTQAPKSLERRLRGSLDVKSILDLTEIGENDLGHEETAHVGGKPESIAEEVEPVLDEEDSPDVDAWVKDVAEATSEAASERDDPAEAAQKTPLVSRAPSGHASRASSPAPSKAASRVPLKKRSIAPSIAASIQALSAKAASSKTPSEKALSTKAPSNKATSVTAEPVTIIQGDEPEISDQSPAAEEHKETSGPLPDIVEMIPVAEATDLLSEVGRENVATEHTILDSEAGKVENQEIEASEEDKEHDDVVVVEEQHDDETEIKVDEIAKDESEIKQNPPETECANPDTFEGTDNNALEEPKVLVELKENDEVVEEALPVEEGEKKEATTTELAGSEETIPLTEEEKAGSSEDISGEVAAEAVAEPEVPEVDPVIEEVKDVPQLSTKPESVSETIDENAENKEVLEESAPIEAEAEPVEVAPPEDGLEEVPGAFPQADDKGVVKDAELAETVGVEAPLAEELPVVVEDEIKNIAAEDTTTSMNELDTAGEPPAEEASTIVTEPAEESATKETPAEATPTEPADELPATGSASEPKPEDDEATHKARLIAAVGAGAAAAVIAHTAKKRHKDKHPLVLERPADKHIDPKHALIRGKDEVKPFQSAIARQIDHAKEEKERRNATPEYQEKRRRRAEERKKDEAEDREYRRRVEKVDKQKDEIVRVHNEVQKRGEERLRAKDKAEKAAEEQKSEERRKKEFERRQKDQETVRLAKIKSSVPSSGRRLSHGTGSGSESSSRPGLVKAITSTGISDTNGPLLKMNFNKAGGTRPSSDYSPPRSHASPKSPTLNRAQTTDYGSESGTDADGVHRHRHRRRHHSRHGTREESVETTTYKGSDGQVHQKLVRRTTNDADRDRPSGGSERHRSRERRTDSDKGTNSSRKYTSEDDRDNAPIGIKILRRIGTAIENFERRS